MASVVSIVSGHRLSINECHRNQPNRSNFYSCLKHMHISNKMECFSYKGGHGVRGRCMHIEGFKIRASLGYRHTTLLSTRFKKVTRIFTMSMCVCGCVGIINIVCAVSICIWQESVYVLWKYNNVETMAMNVCPITVTRPKRYGCCCYHTGVCPPKQTASFINLKEHI